MKRNLWCSTALAVLLLLAGCQQPLADGIPAAMRSHVRVKTALSVLPAEDPQAVKSLYTGGDATVANWNLLVFENGVLKAKYYQDSGADISFEVTTDRRYKYYAVANVGRLTTGLSEGVTSEQDLAALAVDVSVSGGLPMAWSSATELAFSKRQLAQGERLPVQFTRLVGCYDIVIDKSALSAWTFQATSLQVKGAARVTPFSARSRGTVAAVKTDEATSADLTTLNAGGAARFYPVENCYGDLLPAGTDPWNKIPANISSTAFPAYVEMQGKARMTDGSSLERDVTYRFYLGTNASNNFDVVRNVTHTVTLVLSDAAVAASSSHWKVTTGSYTDTRSLAFTHASLLLPYGTSLEEPVVRHPAELKYTIEMDPSLVAAGVTVSGYQWGDPCQADRITLTAPSGSSSVTGEIRLRTLDGAKSATATLTVGKVLESLRIGLWPSQGEERFHSDTTVTLNSSGVSFWAHVYACYSDGSVADVTPSVTYAYDEAAFICAHATDPGKFTCNQEMGRYTLGVSYTEDGVTRTASSTINVQHGKLHYLYVYPRGTQTLYSGGNEYQYTVKAVYSATHGEHEVDPDAAVWTMGDNDALAYAGAGKIRTKYKRTSTYFTVEYAEGDASMRVRTDVSIVSTLTGLTITPVAINLLNNDRESYAQAGYVDHYASPNSYYFEVRAYFSDGSSDDVTNSHDATWIGNKPMRYYGMDSYWHVVDAYPCSGGEVRLYRYYSEKVNWVPVKCAPWTAGDEWNVTMSDVSTIVSAQHPRELFSVSYTHNETTLTATVMGTLVNQAVPQRIDITPNPHEAFAQGDEVQFQATCLFDNGTSQDIRTKASWRADGLVTSRGAGLFKTGDATGTTLVHASYTANGVTVTGTASLVVKAPAGNEHDYSYDLIVEPANVVMDWNDDQYFYAYQRRFDHGVLDTSYGTDGRLDVSARTEWVVDASLLAVATWNSAQRLTANNTTDDSVSGIIRATCGSLYGMAEVEIRPRVEPTLSASPGELAWDSAVYGASSGQTLTIRSNTSWQISGADAHWSLSQTRGSGDAAVTIYPVAANNATSAVSCALTLSASGVANVPVTLVHGAASVTPPAPLRYKVVTSVSSALIRVGETTTASAVLLSSDDDGATYPTTVSTAASSFVDAEAGGHVSVTGASVTGLSAGSAAIRGLFDGYSVDVYEDASLTVDPAGQKQLSVTPGSVSWAWDAAGTGFAATLAVSSNTNWSVLSVPDGFSYAVSGSSIQVWPDAANESFSQEKSGDLVVGGDGASDVTIRLSQDRRPRQLTAISFDRSSYDLVRIENGALTLSQSFALTASYNDGSSENVTAKATYDDAGSVTVDKEQGRLTATAASSEKTLSASYSGLTATARYSAEALECPVSLTNGRMESQQDESRNFLVTNILLNYEKAFESGTLERDVTGEVTCYPSELIVREGYDPGTGQMFHFTAAGEGSITFEYTLNGKRVTCVMQLVCASNGQVKKQ